MKILLTGGAGFIGHNVVRVLEQQGHQCSILDSLTGYGIVPDRDIVYLANHRLERVRCEPNIGDIRDPAVNTVFKKFNPDVVIHLASFPRQKVANQNPVLASDVMSAGLVNLLEASKRSGVKKFVYVSSSMVYGDFNNDVTELAECNPRGSYAILKYSGEKLVEDYSKHFDYTIVRPSAVYGEWDVTDRVVSKFITQAMRGECLQVNGANEVLDFTYVEDTAKGIVLVSTSEHSQSKIYNITRSSDKLWTLKMAAELATSIAGLGTIKINQRDLAFPKRGRLSSELAKKELGYNPQVDFEQGLVKYYEWYQQHPQLWSKDIYGKEIV